jgi:lipopolysaccharide O-acetyltransferase
MNIYLRDIWQRYGILGFLRLVADVIFTKLFFSTNARLIRRPAYIRGATFINFGKSLTTGVAVRLDAFKTGSACGFSLIFGDNVQLNDYVHIAAIEEVRIGNNVLIASRVFISDHNHGMYHLSDSLSFPSIEPIKRPIYSNPVFIDDNVWIGEQVCILPGVKIGKGSVIGAGSVVVNNVPPNSIVVGNPARVIKVFNEDTKVWEKI